MRAGVIAAGLALLAWPRSAAAQDVEPAVRVRIATRTPSRRVYVHEPFDVVLRVAWDRDFFARHAVPLFRRTLDVPFQVEAPWLHALEGAEPLTPPAPPGRRVRVAAADAVIEAVREAEETVDGRPFAAVSVARRYAAASPGTLTLEPPRVRYAYTSRFDDDLVSGPVAADRSDAVVVGEAAEIVVAPLPEAGRPEGFVDAVGRFTVTASLDRASVAVGETVVVAVRIEGEGNLATLALPRLDRIPGLHQVGALDGHDAAARALRYELRATRADLADVAVALAYFDPERGAYAVTAAPALRLEVRAPRGAVAEPAAARRAWPWTVALASVALLVGGFVLVRSRRRTLPAPDPAAVRARAAADAVRACLDRGEDASAAFAAYLALGLRCEPADVVAPDLAARLAAAGVPEGAAGAAAALVEDLVAVRYARGAAARPGSARIRGVVDALETAFARRIEGG